MAGRIRSIKPEILEDAVASSMSDAAWRLWVSSWVLADDHGDLRADARYLGAHVWQDTSKDTDGPLGELVDMGRFLPYAVRGQRYVRVANWAKHQRVDNAGEPRVPTLDQDDGTWNQSLTDRIAESRGQLPLPTAESRDMPLAGARAHSGGRTTTTTTTTTTALAAASGDERAVSDIRGRRIALDWKPKDETVKWAAQQGVDALAMTDEFVEYWLSIAGSKGRRANWDLTFRGRIRRLLEEGRAPLMQKQNDNEESMLVMTARGKERQFFVNGKIVRSELVSTREPRKEPTHTNLPQEPASGTVPSVAAIDADTMLKVL